MHEVVFSVPVKTERRRKARGHCEASDRLRLPLHHGIPSCGGRGIVDRAHRIESKEECDLFIDAMKSIAMKRPPIPTRYAGTSYDTRRPAWTRVGAAAPNRSLTLETSPARSEAANQLALPSFNP